MPETAIPQTPYVRARQEWDERFGDQIKSKNNWRLAAFIAMGMSIHLRNRHGRHWLSLESPCPCRPRWDDVGTSSSRHPS